MAKNQSDTSKKNEITVTISGEDLILYTNAVSSWLTDSNIYSVEYCPLIVFNSRKWQLISKEIELKEKELAELKEKAVRSKQPTATIDYISLVIATLNHLKLIITNKTNGLNKSILTKWINGYIY